MPAYLAHRVDRDACAASEERPFLIRLSALAPDAITVAIKVMRIRRANPKIPMGYIPAI